MERRVLVVDDEPRIRTVLRAYLEADGFAVSEAATGRDALRAATDPTRTPALVLLAIASGLDAYNIAGLRLLDAEPRIIVRARRRGSRVTLIARRRRLQELELTRSPLQRRAGLASVHLEVARGTRLGVRHVEQPLADRVLEEAPA